MASGDLACIGVPPTSRCQLLLLWGHQSLYSYYILSPPNPAQVCCVVKPRSPRPKLSPICPWSGSLTTHLHPPRLPPFKACCSSRGDTTVPTPFCGSVVASHLRTYCGTCLRSSQQPCMSTEPAGNRGRLADGPSDSSLSTWGWDPGVL